MQSRRLGLAAVLAIALAACQPGASAPGATQPAGTSSTLSPSLPGKPTEPAPSVVGGVSALDGTLTWTSDGGNGSGGTSTESHEKLSVTVHLVIKDGGPTFVDAGSTYTYSTSSRQDEAQTLSACGLHVEGTGSGSGPFSGPDALIVGSYGDNNPEVSIAIHAPFAGSSTGTYLCNGQTISGTEPDVATPDCGDPAGGSLVGTIQPGNVMAMAPGQVIDFTCSYSFVIGTGNAVATGSLTSR
jgi:hypothetical protein